MSPPLELLVVVGMGLSVVSDADAGVDSEADPEADSEVAVGWGGGKRMERIPERILPSLLVVVVASSAVVVIVTVPGESDNDVGIAVSVIVVGTSGVPVGVPVGVIGGSVCP